LHASFITGGRELSSYPDHAALQMERRTLPGETSEHALDDLRQIIQRLGADDPTFRASVRSIFGRPAYEIAAEHPLPTILAASVSAVGGTPRTVGASFWADSAVLGHAGIPAVLFGPGGAGLHSIEEYVTVAEVLQCRDTLVEVTRRFCEVPRPGRG
jgi:acetylornithine deacetylase